MARSDRVKSVDFHSTEPWLLVSLYNGSVHVWNHETAAFVKSFEVAQVPVRSAKFIARKSWIVCGSDDMHLRVVNYNTHEKVASFEAHGDYIRSVAVHPTQPFVLSSSDDMLIKLWDWDKGWRNMMTFEGHSHYVMQVVFNLKDANTFASASLDRTIKVWSLGSPYANYTLEGHEKGVNCLEYYPNGDKPYIVSGADDRLVKIWDFQNKTCVQTFEGHSQNISVVGFHPELPIIISGSEDGTVRIWHSNTFRLENTLNYGMERVWAMSTLRGSNDVAFGFDEGAICVKLGREDPAVSMDSAGKIVWARHNDIQQAIVKAGQDEQTKDGERLQLPTKDLGSCEVYPQTLQHSPNGRFVVVCGDGEYIIYTALAWRNKAFGNALEFVWSQSNNDYAVREYTSAVRVYKNFQELPEPLRANYSMEGIFGGTLLGIKSSGSLNFYDWDSLCIVRRIDVVARQVFWSESSLVAVCSDEGFFVLRFNRSAFQLALERGGRQSIGEEGVEAAFEFIYEVAETVRTGCWVGDCFIYTNSVGRLSSTVGGQLQTLAHFDNPMYLLGYIARENRLYLADKDLNVVSFSFPLTVIEFQTAVLRQDLDAARMLLSSISQPQKNKLSRFLESQKLLEFALEITTDQDHQFDLALALKKKNLAFELACALNSEEKLRLLSEFALEMWDFKLAQQCLERANEVNSLLFFYQASGNAQGMAKLATDAKIAQKPNIAFTANLLLGNTKVCVRQLIETKRFPEAALFARTFVPSLVEEAVANWKDALQRKNKDRAAKTIASPDLNDELFPDFRYGLLAEEAIRMKREQGQLPASAYLEQKDSSRWDLVSELKARFPNGVPPEALSLANASRKKRDLVKESQDQKTSAHTDSDQASSDTDGELKGPMFTDVDEGPLHDGYVSDVQSSNIIDARALVASEKHVDLLNLDSTPIPVISSQTETERASGVSKKDGLKTEHSSGFGATLETATDGSTAGTIDSESLYNSESLTYSPTKRQNQATSEDVSDTSIAAMDLANRAEPSVSSASGWSEKFDELGDDTPVVEKESTFLAEAQSLPSTKAQSNDTFNNDLAVLGSPSNVTGHRMPAINSGPKSPTYDSSFAMQSETVSSSIGGPSNPSINGDSYDWGFDDSEIQPVSAPNSFDQMAKRGEALEPMEGPKSAKESSVNKLDVRRDESLIEQTDATPMDGWGTSFGDDEDDLDKLLNS